MKRKMMRLDTAMDAAEGDREVGLVWRRRGRSASIVKMSATYVRSCTTVPAG